MNRNPGDTIVLLQRWQDDGDTDALDELLKTEIRLLRERIRRDGGQMLGSSVSAGDVAQEVALRLLKRGEQVSFETPAALRGYLWQAAWRLLIDRLRRRGRKILMPEIDFVLDEPSSPTDPSIPGGAEEQKAPVLIALNLVSEKERDVLDLVYLQGRSTQEAAASLGISADAAKMRLVRARRHLAERLKGWRDLLD